MAIEAAEEMASSTYNLNRYTAAHKWYQELLRLSREQAYKMVWHVVTRCMCSGDMNPMCSTTQTAAHKWLQELVRLTWEQEFELLWHALTRWD